MIDYPILVEPAKSSKGTCKVCKTNIQANTLRLQVADDRQFKQYIRKHGGRGNFQGQGMSRGGYIETQNGCISIQRYFVHLDCYTPIKVHSFIRQNFKLVNFKNQHRQIFNIWLEIKKNEPIVIPQKRSKKNEKIKDDDQQYSNKKTKKINKSSKK